MATENALSKYDQLSYLTPKLSIETIRKLINVVVWDLFDMIKNDSIKIHFLFVPISFKLEKLSPVIERLVGER